MWKYDAFCKDFTVEFKHYFVIIRQPNGIYIELYEIKYKEINMHSENQLILGHQMIFLLLNKTENLKYNPSEIKLFFSYLHLIS